MNRQLLLAALLIGLGTPAQGWGMDEQARHVAHIEANLEPPVQVRGRPVKTRSLLEEMAIHHTPAISIAVVDHGRIVWAKAYGLADVAAQRPASTRTMFQAGSISKPVAASVALQLIQEGRVALDASANSQLTTWRIPDNGYTQDHPVTVRQLLTHTAGLTVHGFPGYAAGLPVPSIVEILNGQAPANTPPVVVETQPGSKWNYSGGGITVLQLLMTEVGRQPFQDLVLQRLFDPLGMADSTYQQPLPQDRSLQAASGYLRDGRPVEGRFHNYPEMAAAGLWTTPTDLAIWAIGLEKAYTGASTPLMSHASAKAMLTDGLGHWGLGVELGGLGDDFHFTHGGDDWGFKADLMAWPKGGRAVVAMANGDDGMVVIVELLQAVAREYGWRGLEPQIVEPAAMTVAEAKALAGSYGHGLVLIAAVATNLSLTYQGTRVELLPQGGDLFIADPGDGNFAVRFGRGAMGRVETLASRGVILSRDP